MSSSHIVLFASSNDMVALSSYSEYLLFYNTLFNTLKNTLIFTLIVVFIFISIFIFMIMSKNIKERQKDIGVIRTLGANKKDILKIFVLNALVYLIISFVFGIGCYIFGCLYLNELLLGNRVVNLVLVSVKLWPIIFMVVIDVCLIILFSIIPTLTYINMSINDVIRKKD